MKNCIIAYKGENGRVCLGMIDHALFVGGKVVYYIVATSGEMKMITPAQVVRWEQEEGVA